METKYLIEKFTKQMEITQAEFDENYENQYFEALDGLEARIETLEEVIETLKETL
jgi:polyhydroxyalkanoate synthesis regulator phasin